jgi:single-stranded DNA-binding protein
MRNIAEFALIGRIGSIKQVGSTMRVTIASNYSRKNKTGEWVDDAHWNEITIFDDGTKTYIDKYLDKGDLVHARGRIRQASYEKDGEQVYTVNLICTQFACLARADGKQTAPQERPAGAAANADLDQDIPF